MTDPVLPPTDELTNQQHHYLWPAVVVIGLLALGGLAWWLTHHRSDTHSEAGGPPGAGGPGGPGAFGGRAGGVATTVGVAKAQHADMPVILEALGTVTPTATVTVIPQVSGIISTVLFREGQLAKRGEVLVNIDPRSFEIARMSAQGNLQRDEASLASARQTLTRYQTLLAQDSIATQDVDSQAATVKQLEGTVLADQAALNAAKLDLSYASITAPTSGRVGLRVVDVGNYVSAGVATGVAVITVMDPIDVEFAVPQDQIPALMKRITTDKATLTATAMDRTRTQSLAEGQFLTLDNRVDITTGTVKAKAQFPNPQGTLFPNQFVNVRVVVDTVKQALVVPVGAVRQGANGNFVYVLDQANSTVQMRNVKTGLSDGNRIVINDGLQMDEVVITEGADRLKDGATVKMPNARAANAASNSRNEQQQQRRKKHQPQQS